MEQLFYLPPTMIWPLAACLVLTGIHVYLGVHVIARKVIFVDLALAQIAALGTVIGVLLGYEVGNDANALYLYSLAFTIFGAFIFSMTRMRGEKVPHEAIIGIVYAVTFAATILVLSRSALGPQELDHIIKGELLWVQSHVVIKTAIIYAIVGMFHFIFRKKFMAISFNVQEAEASGMNVRFWDFLFYMSFGFVITSSVSIAGVFLVFSYLVIPSVGAMLLSDKLSTRLATGWVAGSIISFIGVKMSYNTGLPTSPVIVVVLAAALIVSGIVRYMRHSERKLIAIRNLAGAAAIVFLFVAGVLFFGKPEEDPLKHTMHMLKSPLSTDRQAALVNLESSQASKDQWLATVVGLLHDQDAEVRKGAAALLAHTREKMALPEILDLLRDPSDDVRTSAIEAVQALGDSASAEKLISRGREEQDPEMKLRLMRTALELGNPDAIPQLVRIMKEGGLFADDAYDALHGHLPIVFSRNEPEKVGRWWSENRTRLKWNEKTKTYSTGGQSG
ncbi:MAG TPA: iron chelate uptake ABC transporter family permease subunit [Bacteroidota bacterium]|jgi:zinc/manganese transport system permease protein